MQICVSVNGLPVSCPNAKIELGCIAKSTDI